MSIYTILDDASASQGWGTETQLDLVMEYITHQRDDAAFKDFIQQHLAEEDEEEL